MYSLGSSSTGQPRRPGRWAAVGPIVLAVVFLVALVLAADHNDVLGWVIAIIAFGWLVLATLSYVGLYKIARFGADQVRTAQSHLAQGSARGGNATTTLVSDGGDTMRDLKLEHSFKIIEVQAKVIEDNLASADAEQVRRALETITITAHNGRGMLKPESASSTPNAGSKPSDVDDGPIAGTVIS